MARALARALARAGADLLVTISANMETFERDHHIFATSRALENGLPHLYVNMVGQGEEFTFVGGTMAVSADGDVLVRVSAMEEEVLELNLEPEVKSGLRPDYLSQLRSPCPKVRETPTVGREPKI